jgi:two-component system, NtrC family, nitrogen regulation sensor histidine kinase NtrY
MQDPIQPFAPGERTRTHISAEDQVPIAGGSRVANATRMTTLRAWMQRRNILGKLVFALMALAASAGIATFFAMSGTLVQVPQAYASALLVADLVIGFALAAVITVGIVRIWAARRAGSAGSRLHVRLVALFTVVAVVPATIVAVLAALFFNFQVQSWFNERVRTAVESSVAVAEAYLTEHRQVIAADALAMANDLSRGWPDFYGNPAASERAVQSQAAIRALSEAIVIDSGGRIIGRAGLSASLEYDRPPLWAIEKAANGEVVILPNENDSDRVRALVGLDTVPRAWLYVGRYVDQNVLSYVDRTKQAADEYDDSLNRSSEIQSTLILIFIVVTLLLVLAAVGVGLSMANRLTRPIGRLALAAERVRAGDLSVRVDERDAEDELGLLARAFNRMTRQLEEQRREVIEANRQIEDRRRFTEAVLAGVSAGVIGLDVSGQINLPNRSAAALLDLRIENLVGVPIDEVVPGMAELIERARARPQRVVEDQLTLDGKGGSRTLLVRIAAETGYDTAINGFVVTFDDISELLSAQRKAAWADVARRIAHEIKNPLTPIQLSAERLKRKYLPQILDDPKTFEQCTDTIVRQVGDIGRMVDEFSAFARMPDPVMVEADLRKVCRDAFALQHHSRGDIRFEIDLPTQNIAAQCDVRLVGQAVINLMQNAVDAIEGRETKGEPLPQGHVRLSLSQNAAGEAVIVIDDNGRGLPQTERAQLTEPYVTTRAKGTGLGLAIVKKIMEDHGGSITLDDRVADDGSIDGARITLVFPAPQATDRDQNLPESRTGDAQERQTS